MEIDGLAFELSWGLGFIGVRGCWRWTWNDEEERKAQRTPKGSVTPQNTHGSCGP